MPHMHVNMNLLYSIFILLVVYQIVNSEERTSSLTFVIDNTDSMLNDIAQVKLRTKEICDAVIESNVSVIENFVLATFNDPGVELRTITTKYDDFKIALDAVSLDGGGDCPEMSLLGIELGIDSSNPESFVYVFTDASAKDYHKYDIVSKKALMKGTEVTFLLTGDCHCKNCPNYKVYDRLASATGGQVFHMDKPNLSEVLNYIVDSVKSKNCLISHDILPKTDGRVITHPFSVDCKMRDVTLSLLGNSPEFKVYHMDGSEVTMTQLVKTKNIYIAKFNNIVPGDYIAKVSVTDGDADLMITGVCSFSFRHGFSPFPPSSINETIFTPSLGEKGFLSVELISEDTANDVNLLGVQIRDIDGNAVLNLTLNIANAKENLYVSDGFVAPDKAFKIAIVGAAENCGKKEIIRVTKSSIKPMNHSAGIFNQVPTIQKLKIITADKDTVSILCKASGYPKPKITWKDKNGDTLSNATAVDDDVTGKQITSILTMIEPEDNLFTCEATNDAGADSDFIPLKLPRKPVIDKTIKEIVKIKGNEVEIFCSLKQGNPKPEISWYFMEENDNEYVKLKYISESLLIYNLGIGNSGSYKCETVNSEGSDTYEMDLFISDPWEKKVKAYEGELVTLNCPGRPNRAQPSVRWFVDDREVVNGGRYHIHRNHSLSFKASTYDYGRYDCVSINRKKRERRKMFRLQINPVLQFRNLN